MSILAVALQHGGRRGIDRPAVGHIDDERVRPRVGEASRGVLDRRRAVGENHGRAEVMQAPGDLGADAARRTGDDRDTAVQRV